jgi:hypothetical protein
LAEGIEWTRQQVVDALQERVQLQSRVGDVDVFEQTLRMPAAQAKEVWGPVVERLIAEPSIAKFIQGYMEDANKQAYLDECATYYDTEIPAVERPATTVAARIDPALKKQIDELASWKAGREKQDAVDRFNREVEQVRQRYPFVVADPALFNDLRETARWMWSQDNSKGLLDALSAKASIYEALAAARSAQEPPVAQSVPVQTLASPGATPTTKRTPRRQRQFADTDEATQAWLDEHPGEYTE